MPSTIQILLTLIFNAFQVVRKILNNNSDIQIINPSLKAPVCQ